MRYRAGWLIQGKVMALTHFDSVVTQDDFMGIASDTNRAIQEVNDPFHILIDNRIIESESIASLDMMLQAMPMLNHPELGWMVMILPEAIKDQAETMPIQTSGHIQLKYVGSLDSAMLHLSNEDDSIDWSVQDRGFFDQV